MNILGISAFFHDSAAALVQDGAIVAAAQEERFTRRKYDDTFPVNAIAYCLREGRVATGEIDLVVFYEKPLTKYFRILRTHLAIAPRSWRAFRLAIPRWTRTRLWVAYWIERTCRDLGYGPPRAIGYAEHHESHAASAFYPSPFEDAAILTMDAVGERTTTSVARGEGNAISILAEIHFPHSLGLLYSAFTYFAGFRVNSGEYKLMGLAPYGKPVYADLIKTRLINLRPDGSFRLNMEYFDYLGGLVMTSPRFHGLFGGPPRTPESEITPREADLAASIQQVTEEAVLNLARYAVRRAGSRNLCLAGGVALNCVANSVLPRERVADTIWIQPAAGDAGGALGAALFGWHQVLGRPRTVTDVGDGMHGSFLGPEFGDDEITRFLESRGYPFQRIPEAAWAKTIAGLIAQEKIVGLFQGRMEFGPRALGSRSILADPRSPRMQSMLNLKIKYRESFRPFAPAVLAERAGDYFELERESPYMLLVADVRPRHRTPRSCPPSPTFDLAARVAEVRSTIPAVTHVDYSARVQTVDPVRAPRFHRLIQAFEEATGCPLVINTSFNVRGEPIVGTPEDAYRCFMRTEMDYLVLGRLLLDKQEQPKLEDDGAWRTQRPLD